MFILTVYTATVQQQQQQQSHPSVTCTLSITSDFLKALYSLDISEMAAGGDQRGYRSTISLYISLSSHPLRHRRHASNTDGSGSEPLTRARSDRLSAWSASHRRTWPRTDNSSVSHTHPLTFIFTVPNAAPCVFHPLWCLIQRKVDRFYFSFPHCTQFVLSLIWNKR